MTDPFASHRSLLFTVAYEMLGSAADAEDVLQFSAASNSVQVFFEGVTFATGCAGVRGKRQGP